MCRVLDVSASGYHAWRSRPPSARAVDDARLTELIAAIHRRSRGTYGVPRVHAELAFDHDQRVGRKRVARLMRAAGLEGVHRRRGVRTTRRDRDAAPAPDLVQRQFSPPGPDRLWVADITYVPTWSGFLYLAVVVDAWSRAVVGWAMAGHLKTELIISALELASAGDPRGCDIPWDVATRTHLRAMRRVAGSEPFGWYVGGSTYQPWQALLGSETVGPHGLATMPA